MVKEVGRKFVGYGIAIVGVIILALNSFSDKLPENLKNIKVLEALVYADKKIIMLVSLALVILGLALAFTKKGMGRKHGREVPIYEGNKIVGYRRV